MEGVGRGMGNDGRAKKQKSLKMQLNSEHLGDIHAIGSRFTECAYIADALVGFTTNSSVLPQTDRATRYVSRNFVNCCTSMETTNPQQIEVK